MARFNDDINVINSFDVFTSSKPHKRHEKVSARIKEKRKCMKIIMLHIYETGLCCEEERR